MYKFRCCAIFLALHILANGQSEEDATECTKKQKNLGLLDFVKESIAKAKEHVPNCKDGENGTQSNISTCGERGKTLAFLEIADNLVSNVKGNYSTCAEKIPSLKGPLFHSKPMDCLEVMENGQNETGVYTIWPRSNLYCNKHLDAYCQMKWGGGGWTYIEKKDNLKGLDDYEAFRQKAMQSEGGFGDVSGDFFVGMEMIRALHSQGRYELRIDSMSSSETWLTFFLRFNLEDPVRNYTQILNNGNYWTDWFQWNTLQLVIWRIKRDCS